MKDQLEKDKSQQPAVQKKENEAAGKQVSPPPFQLKAGGPPAPPTANGGSGSGLPNQVQSKMEGSFGHDFSDVKIEENSSKAAEMGAQAYAQGNTIGFAPGKYNPNSDSGQQLLGHELSHVVQQREGKVQPTAQTKGGAPVNDSPDLEKEADVQGAKAAKGEKVNAGPVQGEAQRSGPIQKDTDYEAIAREMKTALDAEVSPEEVVDILAKIPPMGGFQALSNQYNLISRTPLVMHLQQVYTDAEDYNRVMEAVVGMRVTETPTGAIEGNTGPSMFNLRSGPTSSSTIIGQLNGSNMPITVTGKGTGSDLVWFKVKFKSATDYETVTGARRDQVNNSGDSDAVALMANQEAWVAESALNLHVEYNYFMDQVALFDQMTFGLSIQDKITKLRQMCHSSDLPFDTIIGTDSGNYFQDNRPDTHRFFQILDSAQGVKTPNGEVVDMYHFIVGLDAYQADRREDSSGSWWMGNAGASHAASTWAGDIGAGAADMVLRSSEDMEANLGSEQERLDFYYNSRAPEADLLADVDAWGAYEQVDNGTATNLHQLINNYYGMQRLGEATFKPLRRRALENMFAQYGLVPNGGSLVTTDNQAKLYEQIFKFATVWRKNRKGWGILVEGTGTLVNEIIQIGAVSNLMAGKFLQFLDELARQNEVL